MIGKLPVLGFSLVTALSGTALAHEDCNTPRGKAAPTSYAPANVTPVGWGGHQAPQTRIDYGGRGQVDLRYSDHNRDGLVTMAEAMDSGRQVFRRNDRDNNRVLTRHEMGRPGVRRGDHNNDGRVTMNEYQRAVRARFANLDTNRDGVLARYELGLAPLPGQRSAGWWR